MFLEQGLDFAAEALLPLDHGVDAFELLLQAFVAVGEAGCAAEVGGVDFDGADGAAGLLLLLLRLLLGGLGAGLAHAEGSDEGGGEVGGAVLGGGEEGGVELLWGNGGHAEDGGVVVGLVLVLVLI